MPNAHDTAELGRTSRLATQQKFSNAGVNDRFNPDSYHQ